MSEDPIGIRRTLEVAPSQTLQVVLIDDDPDVHRIVGAVIARDSGMSLMGTALDATSGLAAVAEEQPDVVLLDLNLSDHTSGAELLGPILRISPRTMVAAFSALPANEYEDRLRRLGAFAYYSKDQVLTLPELIQHDHALFRRALAGEDILAPAVC